MPFSPRSGPSHTPPTPSPHPPHPGCGHLVALGLTGEGGRPLGFFFNSPMILACRESWQSLRYIIWFHSAKVFNNSVGYGGQDCGVTEQGARHQGRRDAETPAELFFFFLSLSLSWSFSKCQCGCTPSEIGSTGLFLKMLLMGWEAREKNHCSRGMHTVHWALPALKG